MNDSLSDEELMLYVRNGVGEMLAVLFDRYQVPLFNFFYRLTDNRAMSEDLVQDAFYRILKYRQSYQPGSSFRTWMYQIARNARADLFNKQRKEVPEEAAPLAVVLPMDPLHDQQQISRLKEALMLLPEDKRELLVLSRFQELKYQEIADLLQCQVGTVKVRVHRALQELKENFRRLENTPHTKHPGAQALGGNHGLPGSQQTLA
jgi:RNA polymerase sigma factor (sigma-70 family)